MWLLPLLVQNVLAVHQFGSVHVRRSADTPPAALASLNLTRAGCEPLIVKLGFNTIKTTLQPRGICPYCCPAKARDIRLFLFTKDNPTQGKRLTIKSSLRKDGLDPNKPTIFYIHGFLELSPEGSSGTTIRKAFLSRPERFNVIIVDWSNLSPAPWYLEATQNTRIVGQKLANFIRIHLAKGDLKLENLHLVGFSLGAHAAGFAGKILKDKYKLPRITALDPAYPLFPMDDATGRINRDDANFIDVVHTNPGRLGIPIPVGDVDFFPNSNQFYQPGCEFDNILDENKLDDFFSCSHVRAWLLYSESVRNPKAFPATSCKNFRRDANKTCDFRLEQMMGFNVNRSARGVYYLATSPDEPFGMSSAEQARLG